MTYVTLVTFRKRIRHVPIHYGRHVCHVVPIPLTFVTLTEWGQRDRRGGQNEWGRD